MAAILKSWERLAPLEDGEIDVVTQLAGVIARDGVDAAEAALESTDLDVSTSDPTNINADASSSQQPITTADLEKGQAIENVQQFHDWFSHMEARKTSEDLAKFRLYHEQLCEHGQKCQLLLDNISEIEGSLAQLEDHYKQVSTKTAALHQDCDALLQHKERLVILVSNIERKLIYFDELAAVTKLFNQPKLTVFDEGFQPLLKRCDESVAYISNNPHFHDAGSYLFKFRQLLSKGLGIIRDHFVTIIRSTTLQVHNQIAGKAGTEVALLGGTETSLLYVRFRTVASQLKTLISEIEKRTDTEEFRSLLNDCHHKFFSNRLSLLAAPFNAHMEQLAATSDLPSLTRQGCTYLVQVVQQEGQLAQHFFSSAVELSTLADALSDILYHTVRPLIITQNSLETLCQLVQLLKTEVFDDLLRRRGTTVVSSIPVVIRRMLQDVQERLIFRVQAYIQDELRAFEPTHADLDYPTNLAKASLLDSQHPHFDHGAHHHATLEVTDASQPVSDNPDIALHSLYRGWYPPLELTLRCLSRLYLAIDTRIFEGLAQEAVSVCTRSFIYAGERITTQAGPLDGHLFLIKHLLILREQISPFEIDFTITESALDFTPMKAALGRILSGPQNLFRFTSENAIVDLVSHGAPEIIQSKEDSKKNLEKDLRSACDHLILYATGLLMGKLMDILRQMTDFVNGRQSGDTRLVCEQGFAKPDIVEAALKEVLEGMEEHYQSVAVRMAMYIQNVETRRILLRPIKDNCLEALTKIHVFFDDEYPQTKAAHLTNLLTAQHLNELFEKVEASAANEAGRMLARYAQKVVKSSAKQQPEPTPTPATPATAPALPVAEPTSTPAVPVLPPDDTPAPAADATPPSTSENAAVSDPSLPTPILPPDAT